MKIPIAEALSLLHRVAHGTLATQSIQMPGYPYASVVPCVMDEAHQPVFLISMLAEHTKNLLADARTSLSATVAHDDAQTAARLSLIGDTERFEPTADMIARYLRYQPGAERYLTLDFTFFRMQPRRARFIGGFGKMGWLESEDWHASPSISLASEALLLQSLAKNLAGDIRLLGVDCHGVDYVIDGQRTRANFEIPASSADEIEARATKCLANPLR
ncbi:MAG: pyridoxamine 5-phosphate oxidase family protein [Rhodocyclales bacterium]|nr:pyridoxamine 5-phosphate oxidase family protein [Rhodocyclales bacterium]